MAQAFYATALGWVSFAVWAFVASTQGAGQYIVINHAQVLNKEHALPLVLVSFIWAGFCSVITSISETKRERKKPWQVIQALQVAVSVPLLLQPHFLFEDKATVEKLTGQSFDTRQFIVSIPYRDPVFDQHIGRVADPITQAYIARHVSAKSPSGAVEEALKRFRQEDLAFKSKGTASGRELEPLENLIVAQEEK